MKYIHYILIIFFINLTSCKSESQVNEVRKTVSLNSDWKTIVLDSLNESESDFVKNLNPDTDWENVSVPHNWDQYYGYRRMSHGNLHGTAWYQKTLRLDASNKEKQHFLFFEGVSSYATVWVNGKHVGEHKGGRTTFTLDITDAVSFEKENTIVVKAAHPAFIADLPWVCGGCSGEWGFSEGSQPMGISRPVSLIITDKVRIEPFGIHIWNDDKTSKEKAILHISTELKNYDNSSKNITIVNSLSDEDGNEVASIKTESVNVSGVKEIKQTLPEISNPKLWSPSSPYLYQLSTKVYEDGNLIDVLTTPYGIRWVSWPVAREGDDNRFFINDEPLFINGTCEYEHAIGKSHSFSDTEIKARVEQIKAAGYNSFREGHQPHNLKYQEHLDEEGILFWSQFSAHIWYDTPEFKDNFKRLLREWIKERRNNPSVVMWGLQNESTIPKAFAEECTQIIRELDPTSAKQRIVTTCNGGEGTDWNVIQNWSGTYGGDPYNYGEELTEQLLNGEYGAWRTADLHTEGEFDQKGELSENRFSQLMEIKVREAESVKDKIVGQYHWLLYSHENPGRTQNGEGYRDIDKVGPVNYKGIFTIWGEPLDAFYMYRANYVSNKTNPMVYIVSHSWANRWDAVGVKNGIDVYSNCDEVELFNDVNNESLGKLKNLGVIGEHFQWNHVDIKYNVLYAVGYVNGKAVTKDYIVLNNLPKAPHFEALVSDSNDILKPDSNYNYIYRVNSGGSDYQDAFGNTWLADVHKTDENTWGSLSWTDGFENLPAFYASQRSTNDPIAGTKDWGLFQNFRYGADKLSYEFPLPDGEYQVELYFTEPWYGTGGGMDCAEWRVFDVAINSKVVLKDLDIWSEVGHDTALKKVVNAKSENGTLKISFPNVAASQAVISAIAISTKNKEVKPAKSSSKNILDVSANVEFEMGSWLDNNSKQYKNSNNLFTKLPSEVYGADYLRFPNSTKTNISGSFTSKENATVYVFVDSSVNQVSWLDGYQKTTNTVTNSKGTPFNVFQKKVKKGEKVLFENQDTGNMYSIVVVPTYSMEEQDTRTILKLEAEEAKISGDGVEKAFFKKSDYIEFTKNTKNSITFTVNPGVANIYLLRYRFMNMNKYPVKVKLKIEDANGILLRNDDIEFPNADEKWRILNTTSGGYINAGTYKIQIESDDMKGLRLESFEFQ
ncbi:malectin domain-containing carbohydrate-binding protein [Mariniflexile litorale]|uniref:Malectin domain-containing carbohydrate-binding protein n=1 Tax=Mariniflexile litorale TaxID=3045158 RepID=A0AAU7EBV7_9FLAO|nr:malectin domain-containing carbohydrate-binding protein [Mariniflexile sp. KMM 9835]MDQ8210536.1 malectin domain-containing carbohydrate-binding protein [Mariniflexile sp. KMM 9835]